MTIEILNTLPALPKRKKLQPKIYCWLNGKLQKRAYSANRKEGWVKIITSEGIRKVYGNVLILTDSEDQTVLTLIAHYFGKQ